jgi:hypothetical protein
MNIPELMYVSNVDQPCATNKLGHIIHMFQICTGQVEYVNFIPQFSALYLNILGYRIILDKAFHF